MSFDPQPFDVLQGLLYWGLIFGIGIVVVAAVSILVSLAMHRGGGFSAFMKQTGKLAREGMQVSPRRIWAVSMLTFREAIRKKVLLVFVVFAILFMFAGWFLSANNARADLQVEVHVSFVLKTISLLSIVVMLILACWGLPADIKARSVHTVVTKPVRRHEVYLGRIFGFSMIGTLVVCAMGAVGYFWIVRQVPPESHSHLTCRVPVYGELKFLDADGRPTKKGINVGDIWDFRSYIGGGGNSKAAAIWTFKDVSKDWLVDQRDHRTGKLVIDSETDKPAKAIRIETNFEVFRTYKGDQKRGVRCEVRLVKNLREQTANGLGPIENFKGIKDQIGISNFGAAADEMQKNVNGLRSGGLKPVSNEYGVIEEGYNKFAKLLDTLKADGNDAAWLPEMAEAARKCATAAKAQNNTDLADSLSALADLMQSHKDDLAKTIVDITASVRTFEVQEYRASTEIDIPIKTRYRVNNNVKLDEDGNLFEDFMLGDELSVHIYCRDRNQFLGMARPDLFIRLPNKHFAVGYSKAIFGVWLAVLLVIVLGVTGSTFLKGPVGTLLVVVMLLLGSAFHGFMEKVVSGEVKSSGAFESAYRLINHHNPTARIEGRRGTKIIKGVDGALSYVLNGAYRVVPNLGNFRMYPYVAKGFDVPFRSALLPAILTTFGFFIPCMFLGYLSLASRELEDK